MHFTSVNGVHIEHKKDVSKLCWTLPLMALSHFLRMWDTRTKEVIRSNQMADPINSFDASADKSQLVVAHGKSVSFLDSSR